MGPLRIFYVARRSLPRVFPLMRDSRVPAPFKLAAAGLALLIISPLNVFGDIPILGLLDDAVLLTLLSMLFVWLATSQIEKNVTPKRTISTELASR